MRAFSLILFLTIYTFANSIGQTTTDSINRLDIPGNLGECFIQLDSLVSAEDKNELKNLTSRDEMIKYHHGFGTSIRNRWGLWSGSKLQTYFAKRGIFQPDEMSLIIMKYYYDWLNGNKDSWKNWETDNPEK